MRALPCAIPTAPTGHEATLSNKNRLVAEGYKSNTLLTDWNCQDRYHCVFMFVTHGFILCNQPVYWHAKAAFTLQGHPKAAFTLFASLCEWSLKPEYCTGEKKGARRVY